MNHNPYPNPPGRRKWPQNYRDRARHLWTVDWIPLNQIALQLGVPLSTVKMWKRRSKTPWLRQDRLREALMARLRDQCRVAFARLSQGPCSARGRCPPPPQSG